MTNDKNIVWSGSPSQVINLNVFAGFAMSVLVYIFNTSFVIVNGNFVQWLLYSCMIVTGGMSIWSFLVVKNTKYILTKETFVMEYGVLNKEFDTLELYRVKDYQQSRPLFLRFFKLETDYLITSDRTNEVLEILAIPTSQRLLETIRTIVEELRSAKGVREIDM